LQSQWYHANTFLPLKDENLYITAKMTQKWLVPKCPLLRGSTVQGYLLHLGNVVTVSGG